MKILPGPNGKFQLKSEYDPRLVEQLKAIPGFTWDPKARMWQGYADAFQVLIDKLGPERSEGMAITPPKSFTVSDTFPGRDYQREAVQFMLDVGASGGMCCLAMGLGKTLTAIQWARDIGGGCVVICPTYVRGVWKAEIAKWWPQAVVLECRGTKPQGHDSPWDFAVMGYDVAHAWVEALGGTKPACLVLDEAHVLVEAKSRRGQAIRALAGVIPYRIGLSGTPFTGRLKALWNVCDILSPGRFGSFFKYGMAYCAGHSVTIDFRVDGPKQVYDFSGSSREEELAKRLQCFMFRRTREEVALELPPLTRQILRVDCRASKIDYSDFDQAMFRAALEAAADSKFPEVCRLVQGHAEEGHKVVVFTYRKAVAEAVAKEMAAAGIDSAFIHSGVTDSKRQAILAAPPQVLAATIDSVQMGISLTHADVGVFAELSYEPAKLRQAEARLHRFGQKAGVLIQYVIGADSVDELVVDKVLSKLDLEVAVVGAGGEVLAGDLRGNSEEDAFQNIIAGLS